MTAAYRRVTDSAGITAEYRPLHALQRGDRIAGGWRPWATVKSVEVGTRDLGHVTYEDGASVAFPPDEEFPVVIYDPEDA
jgi:hypothetical protein